MRRGCRRSSSRRARRSCSTRPRCSPKPNGSRSPSRGAVSEGTRGPRRACTANAIPPSRRGPLGRKQYFISYAHEDLATAEAVARDLRAAGVTVQVDCYSIQAAAIFEKRLSELLRSCDGCVVIWSKRSVDAVWVRAEVAFARREGKHVIPIRIDDCALPPPHNMYQTIDFTVPGGREQLLAAVSGGGAPVSDEAEPLSPPAQPSTRESGETAQEIAPSVVDQP